MKQLKMLLLASTVILFTACGGGGGGSSSGGSFGGQAEYHVNSGTSRSFELKNDEGLIMGHGCTYAKLYDSDNTLIANTNAFSYDPIPNPLSKGNYTATFQEAYSKYSDSKGVLYFNSSGYNVDNLPIGTLPVPDRTANLYKLRLSSQQAYTISTSAATITLYNSNLEKVGTTNAFGSPHLPDPVVLEAGTYYFLSSPFSCKDNGGRTFTITPL